MGWRFSIADANVVAWVTAPHSVRVKFDLQRAHTLLRNIGEVPGPEQTGFMSHDKSWLNDIYAQCSKYAKKTGPDKFIAEDVENELLLFRQHFDEIHLFALGAVNSSRDYKPMHEFIERAAYSSGANALFLIPMQSTVNEPVSLLQPFPAFSVLADCPGAWPGMLFWTRNAISAFCPLKDAHALCDTLVKNASSPPALDQILGVYCRTKEPAPVLLQLSDLHYGTSRAARFQEYLFTSVQRLAKKEDIRRILITGDLFDNPKPEHAQAFNFLRSVLNDIAKKDPIVIPGNHDQRASGIGQQKFSDVPDLEWSSLVTDDDLQIHFVCFDSTRDGDQARGRVSEDQFVRVATMLERKLLNRPETEGYRRVALVHHHPFTFEVPPQGFWWRQLQRIGVTEEQFLRMEQGEDFVRWCAERGIDLILHGHKHVPYRVLANVDCRAALGTLERRQVHSIGCGSSTGAGDLPLSMNCVSWDPASKNWAVRFLEDPGDASGFQEEQITIVSSSVGARS